MECTVDELVLEVEINALDDVPGAVEVDKLSLEVSELGNPEVSAPVTILIKWGGGGGITLTSTWCR